MTKRALEIFVTVADEGTMAKAAQKLYITQPSVSNTIAKLETEYDVLLFERLSKKLRITQKGKIFYEYASSILKQYERLDQLATFSDGQTLLRIGATMTVGSYFITPIIREFQTTHPEIDIRLAIDNSEEIIKLIDSNEIDFAIIESEIHHPDFYTQKIFTDRMIPICAWDNPLLEKETLELRDLENEGIAYREEGSATRKQVEEYFKNHHVRVLEKCTTNSVDTVVDVVSQTNLFSVVSQQVYQQNDHVAHLNVKNFEIRRNFNFIHHKDKELSEDVTEFCRKFVEYANRAI